MTMSSSPEKASVLLVGCGCPLRSMGWYHAEQLLANRCPSAQLVAIVEPFYMHSDTPSSTPGFTEFQNWKTSTEAQYGIKFYATVPDFSAATPKPSTAACLLGIISARTADNPALLDACVEAGCTTIYLEKPGAPSVTELEAMRSKALSASCRVYMGFNKNVSAYLTRTQAYQKEQKDSSTNVTYLHNNAYDPKDLPECFERNAEGMLKNMAIHELAILVTFHGVSIDTIASVEADRDFSSCQTLTGPSSQKEWTDFDRLKFKITTKAGDSASVAADRCGGDDSVGIVTDGNHTELTRFVMPDQDTVDNIPNLEALYPGAMPYFFTQDPDYCALKERIAKACVSGTEPSGVATIDVAIESLKLAEYLTPLLVKQLTES